MDHGVDNDGEEEKSSGEDEAMAGNVSSSSSEEGSDWEDIARGKKGAAAKKKQRLDASGRAAGVAVAKRRAAKAKGRGRGMAKAEAAATVGEDQREEGENAEGADGDVDMEARQVFEAKNALPPPNTDVEHNRLQVVERQCRVWTSMVLRNTKMQVDNAKGTATAQLNQTVEKLEIIGDGINKTKSTNLSRVSLRVWMGCPRPCGSVMTTASLRNHTPYQTGLGGYLGFVSCMASLSCVSMHFSALTSNSAMHPIVELSIPPPDDSIDLLQVRLSACRELRVRHRPCAAMVRLLEALSPTIVTLTLQGSAPSQQEINRTDAKRGRHQRGKMAQRKLVKAMRKGKAAKVELPSNTAPVVFPRLRTATIYNAWGRIADDRNYKLPALKDLIAASLGQLGPLSFIRRASAGLSSLHITHDKDVVAHAEENVTLHDVSNALRCTPAAETLVSLTGRVHLEVRRHQPPLLHPQPPPLSSTIHGFVNVMSASRLQNIQLGVGPGEIQSATDIQSIHCIRTSCLAPNATEDYYRVPTHSERRQGIRGPLPEKPHIRLPITGTAAELGGAVPTFQLFCAQTGEATLEAHARQGAVREAPGLDDLVCGKAKKLTIRPSGASHPLPPYVIGNPASLFPAVESVEVRQGTQGMAFYDGGVGAVLGDLPSLESVTFKRDIRSVAVEGGAGEGIANGPLTICRRATVCLVPAAVGFLSAEAATALTVALGFDVGLAYYRYHDPAHERWEIKWDVYEQAGKGKEPMGRVSRIEISLSAPLYGGPDHEYGMTEEEGKAMCRSLADAVAEAFSLFPCLRSVSLSGSRPRFPLVPEIREAAQGRFVVVSGKKSAVEMRPTRTSSSKGGGVKGKRDKATAKAG
ncbi:unnamed protein product [Vitrella brassicaformis CCMP3155]|uniref:Uncharacterized protein n=2 Tax=Vitrella brassicaformis TaxID=1169539 RepID=A0A0G4FLV1_VITBC|nr:unnamed protein product [Vitrella brassicaformis CCMP3155]|eukprot:CEM14997.1 unnamed protein product [Vitrella brassicaformis CCMP3155]